MIEGAVLMLDVAGPFMLKARPKDRGGAGKVKVLENGWKPQQLAFDAGSSLVPAAAAAAEGIHHWAGDDDEDGEGGAHQQYELGQAAAAEVVRNLSASGYKLKPPRSKASYRQSSVESSIGSFKRTLLSSFLPGLPGMTVCTFHRAVQMSVALMNLRPVVLIPGGSADPGELVCASPSSLRGPSHAQWTPLGASRHFTGQMAIVAGQQMSFKRAFKTYYVKRLMLNHNMATTGKDQFSVGDIVMVSDLSSSQGQNPHPVVGIIKKFVDPLHAQAVIAYGAGRSVDRPLQLLVKLVAAEEQVPEQGVLFDPFIQGDIELQEEQQEEDGHTPGPAPARLGAQLQGQQQRATAEGGGHTVQDEVGHTSPNGGEHTKQEDVGEDTGNTGESAGNAGDTGEDEEEEKQDEEAVIASQGWQGDKRRPTRVRKKIDKFSS